ncbi:MAG TPA: hypothetical protein VKV28_12090 [Candidatus Binataceae bacterium]|nr:hypothetical protein [Candidatus Binataceae bacterium]
MRTIQAGCFLVVLLIVSLGVAAQSAHAWPSALTPAPEAHEGGLWLVTSHPVTGLWEGTTRAYCGALTKPDRCNAVQKITLQLRQTSPTSFTGTYSCAYGNMVCLQDMQHGKVISGDLDSSRTTFRIYLPIGITCMYNGQLTNAKGSGEYSCTNGGTTYLEQGMWQVNKEQ